MSAPKGNQFWKMVKAPTGCPKIFKNPSELWGKAIEYFQWVEENPLQEEKLFHFQGEVVRGTQDKMRAMTLEGLCLFIDVDRKTFDNYDSKDSYKEFFPITTRIREVIREQKFTGAAADMLNANIIARDLGLADKKDIESKNANYTIPSDVDPIEAARMYQDALKNE